MKYFGPENYRTEWEEHVDVPVGELCTWCEEAIQAHDMGTINAQGQVLHYSCAIRSVAGSVGHQLGECSCFGGEREDDPRLTRRQAAVAAAALWHFRQAKQ